MVFELRREIAAIYGVVGIGFLLLTASFYLFGFRPLAERLNAEHTIEIARFLESGKWLLDAALEKHLALVKQSASRTAIRNKQAAYLRGKVSLQELIAFSAPKLADAVDAEPDIVGINRYDPDGSHLYSVGVSIPREVEQLCDFKSLMAIKQLRPFVIDGTRRLIYCAPVVDVQAGLVGYDVLVMEENSVRAIVDAGDAREVDIMILFVTDENEEVLYRPRDLKDFPSPVALEAYLKKGARLPGFITQQAALFNGSWQVHAIVNEERFFAPITRRLTILTGVLALVMVAVFALTVVALRPIIRTLVREAELLEMSQTDGLTGLFNHLFGHEQLDRELSRARRSGDPLSILLFDIDFFKQVNDRYGHQVGDEVLRRVASVVKKAIRASDVAVRYGGEEFMLIQRRGRLGFRRTPAQARRGKQRSNDVRPALRDHQHWYGFV